jgi:hypothetical protein
MALISPGVDVTVIDESQYAPSGGGTVPYVLIATAQDKTAGTGTGTAAGTLAANADAVSIMTSQRELVATYGNPIFKKTAGGTPIHGSELNEYGLMTAYSALGVTNRVYVQRADIDLAHLEGTSVRPTNDPADGTYWLDTVATAWGLQEWNGALGSFSTVTPIVITDTAQLNSGTPATSIGVIGDYAVVATNTFNPVYYKKYDNSWILVGSTPWQKAHSAVSATATNPTMTATDAIVINGVTVVLTGTTISSVANDINTAAITGITARNNSGKLNIFIDSTASSDGSTVDGAMDISEGTGTPLSDMGITATIYYAPVVQQSSHVSVPRWRTGDAIARPTGSVWSKTTSANGGASLDLSVYSLATDTFIDVAAPIYENDQTAIKTLDATGGGLNIAAGAVYAQYDVLGTDSVTFKLFKSAKQGTTTVAGTVTSPVLTATNEFSIQASQTGVTALTDAVTIALNGTTAASMVSDILAAGIANVTAAVTAAGAVSITHTKGGMLLLKNVTGTPLNAAGITSSTTYCRAGINGDIIVSNFVALTYTASDSAPNSDPSNGRLWYYSNVGEVDIMIHDGSAWVGYQNETADARGYNLSSTDPAGPIVSASEPTAQSDGTAIAYGDLWIDTSDLENFPVIYRYSTIAGTDSWVLLDNADQTSENGVLFADARWDLDGTDNAVTADLTPIEDMLTSNYLDLDAPDADLYPRGTLLFNTRRSSYNVKKFVKNYFNANDFIGTLPTERDAWVTAAGLKNDGSPYMGRQAVRALIVTALKSAIISSTELREEQRAFTLMACPGYPELIPSMVALNNDRRNTAFIVGDTPMRLGSSATAIQNWANNTANAGTGEDGLATSDSYLSVYYPCGQTSDLSGNTIVQPASHIALRTIIRSDNVSYPWFAAAGVRRGLVDNASAIGVINSATGEFNTIGVTEALRDTLYEGRINPITYLNGVGLAVYGNKTVGVTGSALDRINVARLVVYLRRVVDLASRNFVFEPNDKITRDEIKQVIERALNDLVAKRALTDYLVVCDESNNTPVRRDRNELYVDVAIEPVKAAEFIYVPIRIKAQGAISGS